MPSFRRELTIPVYTADLPDILAFIELACEAAGVRPELWFDLELAVEEACANVIEHAYCCEGGDLAISFEAVGRDVIITLQDHGQPFAPEDVATPDLSAPLTKRRIGGLGMHLMYQLMDEVRFDFAVGINTLVMVKRDALASPPPRPAAAAAEGDDA
jgi:serine/threonine-protein kinase RsbW